MESTPSPPAPAASPARPLTLRQQRFCDAYVLVPNAARAARVAGYSRRTAKSQGWRLLRSRRVRARLAEIQTELAHDIGGEIDALIGKLEVVYRQALEDHRSYAAARAVELQARLMGARTRRQATAPAGPADDDNRRYSEDEIDAMIARAEEELNRMMDGKRHDEDAWLSEKSASVGKGQHSVDIGSAKSPHPGQHPGQHVGQHVVDIGTPRAADSLDFGARSGPLAKP